MEAGSKPIGVLLRETREIRGLSRAALANATGINPNSIAKYEKAGIEGGQFPPLEKLVKLCVALELDPRLVFLGAAKEPDEVRFFMSLDERYQHLNENMNKFLGGLLAVMGMAAKEEMEKSSGDTPVLTFLNQKYADMKHEMEEKGETIADLLMQNGSDQDDPSRSDLTSKDPETAPTVSTKSRKSGEGG